MTCSIEGCGGRVEAKGYCAKHYQRFKKYGDPNGGKYGHASSIQEFINARYEPVTESGCWIWTGVLNADGYGVISFGGKRYMAHRKSLELSGVDVPDNLQVNHRCDVACCINPSHLYVGTQKENIADMISRKRADRKGEKNPFGHKLSDEEVRVIRSLNMPQRAIARAFGISHSAVGNIINRKHWSHL